MTRTPTASEPTAPSEAAAGLDWDGLRAAIDLQGGICHTRVVAELPQHPPIRVLRNVADGIEPLRHPTNYREFSR